MTSTHADILVIGLGAIGSALTYQLARRGTQVLGLDRFHPPHDQGSSHGRTRITRLAIGEGAVYVPLVQRSHALWRELEAVTGESLYRRTGLLVLCAPDTEDALLHGQRGFFGRTVELAQRFGIPHELHDAAALAERFPAFTPRGDERAYHEPDGGVLFPERCVAAHLQQARQHGAQLRLGERVLEITQTGDGSGVRVRTEREVVHAGQVVLTAGAWVPRLAGAAFAPRLTVRRQVLHWFRTTERAAFAPERCPVFMWQHGPQAEDSMYGFPMADEIDGVKVAMEQVSHSSDPDAVERRVSAAEIAAMHALHVRGRLRGVTAESAAAATCLYTSSRDGTFIVDQHPDMPGVTVVSPCSGHGFKHSAGLGEALAQRLLGQTPFTDLAPFALAAQPLL